MHETVCDNVHFFSGLLEESADLLGSDSEGVDGLRLGFLGNVAREHVLRTVNISAELVVVHFVGSATIAVLASDQIEDFLGRRHQSKVLEHTQELLGSDVL